MILIFAWFTKAINENAIISLRDFSYGVPKLEIRAKKVEYILVIKKEIIMK